MGQNIEVAHGNLSTVRVVNTAGEALNHGQARVRVDAFSLSSNNISYAVFGDMMRYWDFFPAGAADEGDATVWGRVPVWGFGEVVETTSADVTVGERFFGYFPMGNELVIECGHADELGVADVSAHRAGLASAYNRYQRCGSDRSYRADREDHQMLLYPLFFTSFVVDDFFIDNGDFGAEQIVVSSASSKTSIGIAYQARHRGCRVVGLTSAGNTEFVKALAVFDEVIGYDDIALLANVASVYVDVAGDRVVRHDVHAHLGDHLRYSMTVGGTHWDSADLAGNPDLPGPTPQFFFAPSQISKRSKEWGRAGLDARMGEAWSRFASWVDEWIEFRHAVGADAITGVYLNLLGGHVDPRVGHICSLMSDAAAAD